MTMSTTTTMTSATTTTVATAEVAAAAQKPPDPHFQVGEAWRLLKGFIADNSRQMRSEREGEGGTEGKREREREGERQELGEIRYVLDKRENDQKYIFHITNLGAY